MTDERFRKYLAFRSLEQIGGADTRELADDLAKEWDGAAYVRVDVADEENAALREQMAKLQVRFDAACEHVKIIQKEYESRLAQVEKERNELQNKIDFEIGIDGYR